MLLNDYPIFDRGIVREFIFCSKFPPKMHWKKSLNHTLERFQIPKCFTHNSFEKEKNPNFRLDCSCKNGQ